MFDLEIDECALSPCKNGGTCVDGINSYNCQCKHGYTGDQCESNIDECASSPCLNGGTCKNSNSSNRYTCFCVLGYKGVNCQIGNLTFARK